MDVFNLFATPITEIFKCLIPSLKRQIAYSVHCERKLKKLKQKVEELETTRNDVQRRIDIAKDDLQSIRGVVEKWLERVERVEKESTTTRDLETIVGLECFRGWCSCGSGSRYDLGRKAEKKMVIIDELLIEGRNFNVVSDPSPPLLSLPTNQDFEVFASREPIRAEVMAALEDERTTLIEVYGMGGVGKTMLMTQVGKQAKEENLFDAVVMTSVSQNIDVKRMQNEIAEQLGLKQLEEMKSPYARAALLSEGLKQKKRVLVILDDLWSNLNLSDVGIPFGENHHKGCKVIITTRILDVCNSQRSKKKINVAVLSKEEAWNLFKKNVGDDNDFPILQKAVAKEVAEKCGGLPVALVTLGRSLRNKDDVVWNNAAHQLKTSKFSRIDEGMNSAVFTSIKLSYDYLACEMIKKCFLFCCLFPEDHKIEMSELMVYAMGDDEILEDSETLIQASGRLHTILDKLVASCLLLGYKDRRGNYVVWMHDIIRDVAILIASEEGNGFCVKAGVMGLTDWPKTIRLLPSNSTTSSIGKCLRLSLMENKISVLPEEPPELPHLLSLSLNGNDSLKKIPDNFFARMTSLATLDLRRTGISSLPSSLSFLVNLRTLYLDNFRFFNDQPPLDISLIGKLKRLVGLCLESCNLERLPEEIRGLTNLKALNLSWNSNLEIIPPNVISSLSRLEYLNLEGCSKIRWGDIVDDKSGNIGSNASLAEVASLPCLTNLTLEVSKDGYIVLFGIRLSNELLGVEPWYVNDRCHLEVSSSLLSCDSIKVLMQRVRSVVLDRCIGLSSLGQLLVQDGGGACFNNMTELDITECHDMEYLMSVAPKDQEITSRIATFVALERLTIRSMNKLRDIFYGTMPIGFLDSLKFMRVQGCEEMVSVLGPNLVKMVPNLEELKVFDCGKLKDVFILETTGSSSSTSLVSVEKEISSSSSSTAVTLFSRLISLFLRRLSSLETVWKGSLEVPFRFHENLKEMEVSFCDKLRCLFSQSMARNLQQLETLNVFRCKSLVKLVTSDEDVQMAVVEEDDDQNVLFPNLKYLYIRRCESLEQLWDDGGQENSSSSTSSSTILDCPYLEVLTVLRCENLKMRIRLTHRCATQLRWIAGDSEDWFQGLEWEDPSDKLHVQPLFKAIELDDDVGKQENDVDDVETTILTLGGESIRSKYEKLTMWRKGMSVEVVESGERRRSMKMMMTLKRRF